MSHSLSTPFAGCHALVVLRLADETSEAASDIPAALAAMLKDSHL